MTLSLQFTFQFSRVLTNLSLFCRFHITPTNFAFSNKFLLELAVPQEWTKTYVSRIVFFSIFNVKKRSNSLWFLFQNMCMLMHMLGERHESLCKSQRLCFTSPWLTSGIQEIYPHFSKSRKKADFDWCRQLSSIVLAPGKKWMEDVTTVYAPMISDNKHWVGLAINLDLGLVEILDPLPGLSSATKVERYMNPVLKSLPYLVKKVAKFEQTQFRRLEPFTYQRVGDIYINERSGDCGPVSVKFMEKHAHGDPTPQSAGITDSLVDAFRKQYVLDLYKTLMMPTYY